MESREGSDTSEGDAGGESGEGGLRIGEALALKWSDVDFAQSKLYVRRSVWRGKE